MAVRPSRAAEHPDVALARGLGLAAGAVIGVGGLATLAAASLGGSTVAAGVATGSVLALVFMWVTRVAVLQARRADGAGIAAWALGSYLAKAVVVVATTALAVHADALVDRRAFGLTLLVGVVASVAVQAAVTRPSRTVTLDLGPAGAVTGGPQPADKVAAR